jgi:hypothetical protein
VAEQRSKLVIQTVSWDEDEGEEEEDADYSP